MVPTSSFAHWRSAPLLIALLASPSSAGFTIRDLGAIVDSGTSGAQAINAAGGTAGTATGPGGATVAVMSSGSGNFQAVPVSGATSSVGRSINLAGDVAGTYTDGVGVRHGFVMSMGQMNVLKPLTVGGLSGTYTLANGINDSGQVVGTGDVPGGTTRAFTMGPGGSPTIIAPLGSGTFDVGNGINNNGTVVGASEILPGGLQHAFITNSAGTATDLLGRNSAGNFRFNTYGIAINNNGDVVGNGDVGSFEHAFYASSKGGALVDLGILTGGTSSLANAVNDQSYVVGEVLFGSSPPGRPNSEAFVWNGSNGIVDLNSLLLPSDRSSWVLTDATGINDSDQISGQGYLNGVLHGFVLTPMPGDSIFDPAVSIVPEPPTLLLSALGLAIAAARARFRRGRTGGRAAA